MRCVLNRDQYPQTSCIRLHKNEVYIRFGTGFKLIYKVFDELVLNERNNDFAEVLKYNFTFNIP